jgi:hypothetical protein
MPLRALRPQHLEQASCPRAVLPLYSRLRTVRSKPIGSAPSQPLPSARSPPLALPQPPCPFRTPVHSRSIFAPTPTPTPTHQKQKRGGLRGEIYCITEAPSARRAPPLPPLQAGALRARAGNTISEPVGRYVWVCQKVGGISVGI